MRTHLAKLLVRGALVNDEQIREALSLQRDSGYELGESLVQLGYITEPQLVEFLGREYGVPVMDIDDCDIEESVVNLIPKDTALEKFLVPIRVEGPDLTIAVSDPSNILLLDDLGFITGKNIKPVVSSERSIKNKLSKYYGEREPVRALSDDQVSREPGNADSSNDPYLSPDKDDSTIDEMLRELDQYNRDQSSENSFTGARERPLNIGHDSGPVDLDLGMAESGGINEKSEELNKPDDEFVFDFTDTPAEDSGSSATDSGAASSISDDLTEASSPLDEVLGMSSLANDSYSQDVESGIPENQTEHDDDSANISAQDNSSQFRNFFSQIKKEFVSESADITGEADIRGDGGEGIGFAPPSENGSINHEEFSPVKSAAEATVHAGPEDVPMVADEDETGEQEEGPQEFEAAENVHSPADEFVEDLEINSGKEGYTGNAIDYSPVQELDSDNSDDSQGTEAGPDGGNGVSEEESSEIAPIVSSAQSAVSGTKEDGARRSVLIVDVSPTVQKIMRIALERAGYRVYAASDGMQALARINEAIPDLIFVDIKLPHMDGYQLCKVIKSHGLTKGVPVVMLSGKAGVLDKMKVKMAGASDFIAKPFGSDVIIEAAERYAK